MCANFIYIVQFLKTQYGHFYTHRHLRCASPHSPNKSDLLKKELFKIFKKKNKWISGFGGNMEIKELTKAL